MSNGRAGDTGLAMLDGVPGCQEFSRGWRQSLCTGDCVWAVVGATEGYSQGHRLGVASGRDPDVRHRMTWRDSRATGTAW